ncbi:MAG: GH92 family glycosyl hydrolase [Prevotella sp.]|nr:GH92 family glycosyl hydrolase [Prevotella sp.]
MTMKLRNNWLLWMLFCSVAVMAQDKTAFVDPFIGTGGHGHVFLGANVPFGFVQVGPTNHTRGWDWCSGYHVSDSVLVGFSHTHLSGTGCGDLGDVAFLPVKDEQTHELVFSHQDERCRPGYYSLRIRFADGGDVLTELTATERTAFHRYSFSKDIDTARIAIDLKWGVGWDRVTACAIRQESARMLTGYRHSTGWADNQKLFFVAEFSEDVQLKPLNGDSLSVVVFRNVKPMLVKVALSAVSIDNARENLKTENPSWNFESVCEQADKSWEQQLAKIHVNTHDQQLKKVFYTCLYHTMVAPSVFNDVNGDYRGSDGEVHHGDFTNYTTFSLWDTYRAAHPLATIIHPERQQDFAATMLHIYQEQKTLPVWHLMGCETNCMVGNPAIPVLADLILKGFSVDRRLAIEAMERSVGSHKRANALLRQYGYIPYEMDKENESIGKGMEYAIAYGCALKVAPENKNFRQWAASYKSYFDPSTGFMRARDENGRFRPEFDPFAAELNHIKDYTEGNAWQYIWLVPHDVSGLVSLFGGERAFTAKLDSLFVVTGDLGKDAPPDITGLIGQYAHGNEPSHHIAYLYNYVGQQWKTAAMVRRIMRELYHTGIDGLCGNEDVGQMSAWYILSALGIYQVDPAGGRFVLGSPLFDDVSVNVGEGKQFRIVAHNNSPENIYIQRAVLNGKPYTRSYIDFKDFHRGATLELYMGSRPSRFGTAKKDRP